MLYSFTLGAAMTFKVQKRMCETCIYRKGLGWNIEHLEEQVRDRYVGFKGFRECHHAKTRSGVCCAGFWTRHKDEFQAGQIAQRLGLVEYVNVDVMKTKRPRRKA